MFRSVITGTGSYIPETIQSNTEFNTHIFYGNDQKPIETAPEEVVKKFRQITGIEERRYVAQGLNTSDIAAIAGRRALEDSDTDPETIDQIIVAHNFGNVITQTIQTDAVPSLANRVKFELGIHNPDCVCYDILFGCPGWLQAMIQADAFFKAGLVKKCLLIGAETLSRVIDMYDRDSMIFSDGAGACILENKEVNDEGPGILGACAQSHSLEEAYYIDMGQSFYPGSDPRIRYIKMKGRKVYEYAMKHVPAAMKRCLEISGIDINDVKKIFIHQANEKMDEGIITRLYQLYGIKEPPKNVTPMSIQWLGNSSVATVPTLFDLVRKGQVQSHELSAGDIVLFASVGAGMNINAVCYRY
ncbi:MAG TPA: ketoacyl-ACP synthase III [Chitinophagaceae bacterium]|nr:ketoacyl-ACP synthase III [Chitinophagaceae bacterium]